MASRVVFYKGKRLTPEDVNVWGTPKDMIGEGFCRECERENPYHYDNCPHYVKPQLEEERRKGCAECGSTGAHKSNCSKRRNRRKGTK